MWDHLAHPEWLEAALATAIVASGALLVARALARRRRRRLLGMERAPRSRQRVSDLALLVALAAILIALLGPRLGERVVKLPGTGVDVVILMDVSRSMDARDVPPSRLDRARRIAANVLERLDARDRVALAAFGGRGVLLTPLTPDRSAIGELLPALDTGLIHPAGSDLGAGMRAALDAFSAGSERPRVVLALGDGEDPEARSDLAGSDLRQMDTRVIAVAIGTEAGSAIPDRGAELRDRRGEVVVTRRRASRLERITTRSEGALFLADAWGRVDGDALLAAIRRDAGSVQGEPVTRRIAAIHVVPFAALAFALLLVEGLPRTRGLRRRLPSPALLVLLVAAGPLLAANSAGEAELDAAPRANPRELLWIGLDRLERGESDAAARAFEAAAITARDPSLAALAYYDLAIACFERGDLDAARDALFDALALDPGDRRARFNLEWTLRALSAAAPEPPDPEPEDPPSPDSGDERGAPEPATPSASASEEEDDDDESPEPARGESRPRRASPPDESVRERWMARVEDDLGRALQSAAASGDRARGAGPVW